MNHDNTSPVTFKSVRNIWMARDKPSGPRQRIGEAPQDMKDKKAGGGPENVSEQTSHAATSALAAPPPPAPRLIRPTDERLQKAKSDPTQLVGSVKSKDDGVPAEAREQNDTSNSVRTDATNGASETENEPSSPKRLTQGALVSDEEPPNAPGHIEKPGSSDSTKVLDATAVLDTKLEIKEEKEVVTSPISETARSDFVSLPEISESEDGDRSLSSPGSDGPIRRAPEEGLHPDSGLSPREEERREEGKPEQALSGVSNGGPVDLKGMGEGPAKTQQEPSARGGHDSELTDDLENAKPAARKSTGSPPPDRETRNIDAVNKAMAATKPLLAPKGSPVTSVEMSHHQHVVGCLHKKISELTSELNTIKTERDIQKLVNLPPADSSKLVAEMQSQLVEKDKRLRTLEKENADYKRNQMIQAVELQELSDHCQGLEKQRAIMEKHVFPALPQLQTIRETSEDQDEDANHVRMAKLANAALRSAEEEIAALKKGEHRRQQLELMMEHARLKIASMQGAGRASTSPSPVNRMWEETRRQSNDGSEELRRQLDASQGELSGLRRQLAELEQKQAIAHAVAEEARALLAQRTQEVQDAQRELKQHQQQAAGPAAPVATASSSATASAAETATEASPQKHSQGSQTAEAGAEEDSAVALREAVAAAERKAEEAGRQAEAAGRRAEQAAREAEGAEGKLGQGVKEVEMVRGLAGEGLEVLRGMEECLAGEDPLVSVLAQRTELGSLLRAIASRSQALVAAYGAAEAPERPASASRTREHGAEGKGKAEELAGRVRELERSERFLKEELENASTALAKARAQNTASGIELGILRNQLEGVTSRSPGGRPDEEGLQGRVQRLEREREQLIQCLDDLNRSAPAGKAEAEAREGAVDGARGGAGGGAAEMVQSLMKEKHSLEATVVELRHLRDVMQADNQEARLQILHLQRDSAELQTALQGARAKVAEGHEELVLRRKEVNTLSKNLQAVSAALEATNSEVQPSRPSHDHGSPSSTTSENDGLQQQLAAAREEVRVLHEKMIDYKKQHEQGAATNDTSEQLRHELSLAKQEIDTLRQKAAEQEQLLLSGDRAPAPSEDPSPEAKDAQQQELSRAKDEINVLREKMAEMEKQMALKKQKLAVLAEYKMQMVKQHGELCIKDT